MVKDITLEDYLATAAVCYSGAYEKKTIGLKPLDMYKKWADGRDEGMLSIKNRKSKNTFSKWYHSRIGVGHPFEIVFSWFQHGIHLYPPRKDYPFYSIMVTNLGYTEDYIKMIQALIDHDITFQAPELDEVVKFLSGETYFNVNELGHESFFYISSMEYKREYFKHIKWEELKIPIWK